MNCQIRYLRSLKSWVLITSFLVSERRSRRREVAKSPVKNSPKKNTDVELCCIKCGARHKMSDLLPKLFDRPRGDWHCPECLRKHVPSLMAAEKFGFEVKISVIEKSEK